MTPAVIIPIALGRLRRAVAEGDVEAVLSFTGSVLRGGEALEACYRREVQDAFFSVFWLALEDPDLSDLAGDLDLLMARMS